MARTAITPQAPTTTFLDPTYNSADSANGNSIAITGKGLLFDVKNTNGSTRTLTVTTTNKRDGFTLTSPTYVIPATTGNKVFCLSSAEVGALAVSGVLQLDWTADTGVTFAVFETR